MEILLNELRNYVRPYTGEYSTELELELESTDFNVQRVGKYFKLDRDGSLRGNGFEFSTSPPCTFSGLKKAVKIVMSSCDVVPLPSHRTSTHLHMNVQHFTHDELIRMLVVYYLLEHLVIRFCGAAREDNLFCLALSDAEGGLDMLKSIIDKDWAHVNRNYRVGKYACLNVVNITKFGTVELRCFPGLTEYNPFGIFLDIFDSFNKAKNFWKTPREIWNAFNLDREAFARKVFGEELWDYLNCGLGENYDLMDRNYSLVYHLVTLWETRDERTPKKRPTRYYFLSERDMDLDQEDMY